VDDPLGELGRPTALLDQHVQRRGEDWGHVILPHPRGDSAPEDTPVHETRGGLRNGCIHEVADTLCEINGDELREPRNDVPRAHAAVEPAWLTDRVAAMPLVDLCEDVIVTQEEQLP